MMCSSSLFRASMVSYGEFVFVIVCSSFLLFVAREDCAS